VLARRINAASVVEAMTLHMEMLLKKEIGTATVILGEILFEIPLFSVPLNADVCFMHIGQ
jgi:hypothetical protein